MMNKEEFIQLLQDKKYKTAQHTLSEMNDMDTAAFLEELDAKECALAFRLISKEKAANVFSCMSSKMQTYLVDMFSETELKELLDDLYMDDTVDMLEDLPANLVTRILKNLDSNKRSTINKLLKYPEDSAGSIMTTEYVTLKKTMTVKQAMNHIKDIGIHKETIYTCYVTENKRLMGIVTAKSLMTSDDDENITNLMNTNIISVHTHTDQEQVAHLFRKYDLIAMPVLDSDGCLVGIVTFDDAMDVMEEEATEDMEKMAAITPTDKPYLKTGVVSTFKARIPWLLLLMVSATFTGLIIANFENSLAVLPVLTAYIPMLMDTGGNCGSQSSVTVIRAISLSEVDFSDIFRIIWKELRVALLCGVVLAVANFGKMMLVDRLLLGNTSLSPMVAAVVCGTLVCTIACAKFVGCSLPLLAKKIGLDPAVMASPFITTIVDALSLLIYFAFAKSLLGV